jgi:hypothetical protein
MEICVLAFFELSSRERALRRDGVMLPLGSKALDILLYFASVRVR